MDHLGTTSFINKIDLLIDADYCQGCSFWHGISTIKHLPILICTVTTDNLLVNQRDLQLQRPICKVGDFGLSRIKRNILVGVRGTLPLMAAES
ncbi:unnamed protein product [Rhodiola kirilowii]